MLGGFSALSCLNAMAGSCGAVGAKQGEQTDFMRVCAGAHMCEHVAARGHGSSLRDRFPSSGPREPPVATLPSAEITGSLMSPHLIMFLHIGSEIQTHVLAWH